jgi:hypothetical protein
MCVCMFHQLFLHSQETSFLNISKGNHDINVSIAKDAQGNEKYEQIENLSW